jgi:large subunit ribosomal protein L14
MLREKSIVDIADNSGAVRVSLFSVTGKNRNRSATIGSIVAGSVKKATIGGKVKKGQIVYVLITGTRRKVQRRDGTSIKFSQNLGVLLNKGNKEMIGTRVFGPVAREIRELGYNKIVSLADEVL